MADFLNIKSIINKIAGVDSAGSDTTKIDTMLEYNKLSRYLNGSYYDSDAKKWKELSPDEIKALKEECDKAREELKGYFEDKDTLPKITDENAKEYVRLANQLSYKDELTSDDKISIKKIKQALYNYAEENGYDLSDFTADSFDYDNVATSVLKGKKMRAENNKLEEKSLNAIKNPYDNKKLEKCVAKYIKENNIPELTESNDDVDLGNGEYDKPATQTTELCWAHSGINTLLRTEEGTNLIKNNRYYDQKTGVFAIHLQEAEDNGCHDGIYIITPEDLKNEGPVLSEGEGDVTAYMIAIKRYFDEVNSNPKLAKKMEDENKTTRNVDEGNYNYRFYELITGGKHAEYSYFGKTFYKITPQNGIGVGRPDVISFDLVSDIVKNKKGSVSLTLAGHSISVVDVQDDDLIVQESNNDRNFPKDFSDKKLNHTLFHEADDINGAPAYKLSKEDYMGYINSIGYIKWK